MSARISGMFSRWDYAEIAKRLRDKSLHTDCVAEDNLTIILAALDIAAADPAPRPRLSKAAPALLAACREALTLHEDDEGIAGVLYAAIASAEGDPEGDGDRTVHPALDRVPDTELLRRVTELEKLANALALRAAGMSSQAEVHSARNAWLKMRTGEWV